MSHQGYEGWFPECISCGAGNVGAVVCLDPTCHEVNKLKLIESKANDEKLIFENEHWWKCCQLCDCRIHADGGAFGTYAMCIDCYKEYVNRGVIPPTTFRRVEEEKKK
jgi:hypothetical protein